MFIRRVEGSSMRPTLYAGQIVIGWRRAVRVGQVVLARRGAREIVKRVQKFDTGKVYLIGDNGFESTDSRHYGFLDRSAILGAVMIVLPKAVHPPKPVHSHAVYYGRIAAALFAVLAVVHLFRIDEFMPILDTVLPGGATIAGLAGAVVILSEVFAIPFALRMKLSPLAHLVSGALMVLAPLWWILIDIWSFGLVQTTGQLSSFVDVPATVLSLMVNVVWLAYTYYALYLLGYNSLRVRGMLKK